MDFEHGPYGEIFAPHLAYTINPEEAVTRLVTDTAALGGQVHVPANGHAREGYVNVALDYMHQLRLRDVLAGACQTDTERALYQAIVERGERLSLRPPEQNDLTYDTFAPVLSVSHDTAGRLIWQLGLPEYGHVKRVTGNDPGRVVARLQALFAEWSEADDDAFDESAKTVLESCPPSLFHDFWLSVLERTHVWGRGGGYRLTWFGRHNITQLDRPNGTRILDTARRRAVRLCDALARQAGVAPVYPPPAALLVWLVTENAPSSFTAEWHPTGVLPASIQFKQKTYALVRRRTLVLYQVEDNGRYGKVMAETTIEPIMDQWLAGDADGRAALVTWALWAGGLREL